MEKKFEKSHKKRHTWLKVLLAVVLVILLLLAAVVVFVWSKLNLIQFENEIPEPSSPASMETSAPQEDDGPIIDISGLEQSETTPAIPNVEVERKDEVINILLIGTDERSKEFTPSARSDSMILVSINKDDKTVKLVSLERGMGVPILDGTYEGQWDWLTHIFRYGGAELLTETIEYCFKVEIDHYVRVNFTTVTEAVDAIGGVDVELTATEAWALTQGQDLRYPQLNEGMNHLNGAQALDYARLRRIDSDWERVQRQRKVILAVVEALKGSSLGELNNLLDQVLPLVQTNMTMLEIADLMLYSPNFLASTFDQMTIPKAGTYGGMTGLGGKGLFAVDFEVNNQILREFLYGEE